MKQTMLCALVVLGAQLAAAPSHAQTTPAASPEQPRSDILRLVSQTPVVEPDGDFVVRVRVIGAPTGAKVRMQVHDRVPTRTDFNTTLNGKVTRRVLQPTVTVPSATDASGVVVVTLPTRDTQSQLPAEGGAVRIGEGVFPVTINLLGSNDATLDSLVTYLIRMPVSREFGPFGVAIVLPVGGPLALQPDGSTTTDATTAQAALSTAAVLEAHPTLPLTVLATPETIDSLDPSTTDELRRAISGRQLPVSPYVRVRPSDLIDAGLRSEVDRQFDLGGRTLTTKFGAHDTTTYVADDGLTPAAAQHLRARGVTNFVIPESSLSPVDEGLFNRTLTQPFNLDAVDNVHAVQSDTALGAHAGTTGDPVLDASRLLADLSVLYFDDPPDRRAAVVTFTPDQHVDPQLLDVLLTGLDPSINRILQPITLATLFTGVPPAGSRGETNGRGTPLVRDLTPAPGDDLSSFAADLRETGADIASYRAMVTADNPRPNEFERRALVAAADGLSDEERTAYLDGARTGVRSEIAKVQPPVRQTINFTARDGVVSLTLRNTSGYPMKVRLLLQGDKLEFPGHEDGTLEVTLTDETTRVPIDVHTRASGDSPLDVTVSAPDSRIVIGRTRVTVRSTAFSGVGVVLSVGAGLFLAVWWLRHAIASQRERRRRMKHAAS